MLILILGMFLMFTPPTQDFQDPDVIHEIIEGDEYTIEIITEKIKDGTLN